MARVIEPIGLLALLLRRSTAITTFVPTNNATTIPNICTIGNLRMYSSLMKNGDRTFSNGMLCFSRHKSTSDSNSIMNLNTPDKKVKQKKATTIKKLHKANKEMFGELLETQQEKVKRVKKELKKPKTQQFQLETSHNNVDAFLELEDQSVIKKVSKASKTSKTKVPKSLPMTEKTVVKFNSKFNPDSPEDFETVGVKSKKGEISWTLRNNPKMTKIIGTSYNQKQTNMDVVDGEGGEIPLPIGRGQGEFVVWTRNPNGSLYRESGGASSSGQSSIVPAAGEAIFPSVNQFNTSLYECQDMQPSSEMKVIKKPSNVGRTPMNISKEAIYQLEASSESIDDMREFDQSLNTCIVKPVATHKNNMIKFSTKETDVDENQPLKSKLSSSSSPPASLTKTPFRQMTNKDEDENQKIFLQENGNGKMKKLKTSTTTDNTESAKADNTSSNNNVRNQKSSPILINVPYFNTDRLKLAEELNPNPNSHDGDADNDNQKNQIISIPFPRTFYNSFENNNNQVQSQLTENSKNYYKGLNLKLPSVSKILNVTMPKEQAEALERWQAKMILQMGEDGFRLYKENMLNNGKMLHSNIETHLRGTPLDEICVAETNSGHWSSLKNIIGGVKDVKVLESRVVHPQLMYCGIVDCVALYRNKLVLIDWKTSQKQKPFVSMTYDTPLQIAAYIGAINYDPNYSFKIEDGLIVIAYEDGTVGQTFLLKSSDVAKYWGKWLERLNIFNQIDQTSMSAVSSR